MYLTCTSFVFLHITSQFIITTIAGKGASGSNGDGGAAIDAELSLIGGVTVDISGNVYLSDTGNCAIRLINKHTGIIKTVAGTVSGHCGSSGDGFAAIAALLYHPSGVSLSTANDLYIADSGNNKIRLVNGAGIISTFAGTGELGSSGDGHLAINARLNNPTDVAIGLNGNVFIADSSNNKIRVVNSLGIIKTFAGVGGYYMGGYSMDLGDGGKAINATLSLPSGVAADLSGNVYIADTMNSRIRVVNTAGFITTFAGGGYSMGGYSLGLGDGYLAVNVQLNYPAKVTVDSSGNVYIADSSSNVIRIVTHGTGIITTFAGVGMSGMNGFLGDNGPASRAYLYSPGALTVDVSGALYIADTYDYRVRKVVSTINYPTSQPSSHPSTPSSQPTLQPSGEPSKFVWHAKQQVCLLFVVLLPVAGFSVILMI